MKKAFIPVIFLIAWFNFYCGFSSAADDKNRVLIVDQGIKSDLKVLQDKIDNEREMILEDGRKMQEAKRAGNEVEVEKINQDISNRKAEIKRLKDEKWKKSGGRLNTPSSRRRVEK